MSDDWGNYFDWEREMRRQERGITHLEHDQLLAELGEAEKSNQPLLMARYHEIIHHLLSFVRVSGHAPYDPRFGDERVCICGHPYHRHFDSYEEMSPVGCKYCGCDHFIEPKKGE